MDKSKIICIDIETTGTDLKNDEILQLSIVRGDGQVLFNHLLRPTKHLMWPEAEKVNHISPSMTLHEKTLGEYLEEINQIISDAKLIVGYNHEWFDIPFMRNNGIVIPYETDTYDVMLHFAPMYGNWDAYHQDYRWVKLELCAWICNYPKPAGNSYHDSLADVMATLHCYYHCVKVENIFHSILTEGGYEEEVGIKSEYLWLLTKGLSTKELDDRIRSGKYTPDQVYELCRFPLSTPEIPIPDVIDEYWSCKDMFRLRSQMIIERKREINDATERKTI